MVLTPELAFNLSQKLRWPHTLEEWKIMDEISPIIGMGRDGGAGVSATAMLTQYPWGNVLGMVLVDPEIQRLGLGTAVTKQAISLSQTRENGCIVLTASHDAEVLYQKLGFERAGSVFVLKGKGYNRNEPSQITCSAKDISKEFYQECPVREKILKKIVSASPNNYYLGADDEGCEAFASSIRRVASDGQESLVLGPVLLRKPESIVPLLDHFLETSSVGITCFVFSRFNNEDDLTKSARLSIMAKFNAQGFSIVDELQFMIKGGVLPSLYTDSRIVSPITLAFG